MTTEEKYKKILFAIAEYAMLSNNDDLKEIIERLNNWRYVQVNSIEGQSEEEYNNLVSFCLNKTLEKC